MYAQKLQFVLGQIGDKPIYVFTLDTTGVRTIEAVDTELLHAIDAFNEMVYDAAEKPNVKIVRISEFLSQYAEKVLFDYRYYLTAQMPYNPQLIRPFQAWWKRRKAEIEQKRKYIYNTGFRRSKTLAGVYSGSSVLVVEGFLDMLKARQNGLQSVVAVLGWKMSDKQKKKLLHRGIKTIICGLDNDQAGEKGYRYLQSLSEFDVVRLNYPDGIKDFGDVDKDIFQKYIRKQIKKYKILEE